MEKQTKKNPKAVRAKCLRWGRVAVQIVFFIFAPALFSQAFAGVKEVFTTLGSGQPLVWSAFVLRFIILCLLTILFGRIFCGWACAFGALGDWIYQFSTYLQKKAGKKPVAIPLKVFPVLQKLKYLVLLAVVLLCFLGENSWITKYSPWTVFSLFTARNFAVGGYTIAIILLLIIIVGMAVQERFFCQFLCPLGAVFSLLPELPFFKLKRNKDNCIPNCQLCKRNCPVRIKIEENPVQEGECISCGRCAFNCPKKNVTIRKQKNVEKK